MKVRGKKEGKKGEGNVWGTSTLSSSEKPKKRSRRGSVSWDRGLRGGKKGETGGRITQGHHTREREGASNQEEREKTERTGR